MALEPWYRIVGAQRTTPDEVLKSRWGRFHDDPDIEPTSYLADSLLTAWREVTARLGAVQVEPDAFRAWRVTLGQVNLTDLRNVDEQARYQVKLEELLVDPAPPKCKEVARKLRQQAGCNGIIYPSVRNRPGGVCLALFLERSRELITFESLTDLEWMQFIPSVVG